MNVDLTGKLGLAGRPTITIGDTVLTVDDSAPNLLRIFEIMGTGEGMTPADVMRVASLIFEKPSAKALDGMRLSFMDYATVVNTAVDLVMGGVGEGNAETPATT